MSLFPPFDAHRIFIGPWQEYLGMFGWIVLMGFVVMLSCGLVGNFLILRRTALIGDAVSHSILPGIAIAFLATNSRGSVPMFVGALVAGIAATILIESVHRRSRIKEDAAIGIVFSTLFAIGVVLISVYAGNIDLDADCVLYGELGLISMEPRQTIGAFSAPAPLFLAVGVCLGVIVLLTLFYKELLVSSFDPSLAVTLGLRPGIIHYALMCVLSLVVVSAFRAVGAILVVAMLILPGATGFILVGRLPSIIVITVIHAALSAVLGMHLSVALDCHVGPAMVVAGAGLFVIAWIISGLRRRSSKTDLPLADTTPEQTRAPN